METRAGVDVRKYTDSVYEDAKQSYEATWPGGGVAIKARSFKDVVVWNPQAEAGSKIGDMEDGGWCVFFPGFWSSKLLIEKLNLQGEICLRRTRPCPWVRENRAGKDMDWPASHFSDTRRKAPELTL